MLKIELYLPDELEAWLRQRSCGQFGDEGVRIAVAAILGTAFAMDQLEAKLRRRPE